MALREQQALRDLGNARLRSAFAASALVTRLDVSWGGTFVPQMRGWADYWRPVHWLGNPQIDRALRQLGAIWQRYIASSFDPSLMREYCFRYFSLLDAVLSARDTSSRWAVWQRALQAVLGFECFGLSEGMLGGTVAAAGTTALRNPCYLLAKLESPDGPDDTRFLPLILAGDDRAGSGFFHYRRYRLSEESPMSLMVYPASDPAHRPRSFRLVAALARALGSAGDPFAETRAERLWRYVLRPIVQVAQPTSLDRLPIEFVDVGAGSSALTAALCQELVAWSRGAGFTPRLRLWLVDVSPPAALSVFRTPPLGRLVESLVAVSRDYRTWLAGPKPLPAASGLRVALASKVFDVSSRFSIDRIRTDVLSSTVGVPGALEGERYLPERCLAPRGEGPSALQVSSRRVVVEKGHMYPLASLSGFFRGLRLLSRVGTEDELAEDDVCLPVRSLDPGSLVAADGASVIGRLLEQCDYLIVEDADLRPRDLIAHLRAFSLQGIAAQDMTRAMGLTANYAYVVWLRGGVAPRLEGERIW
ncbi:MAG: hypothetical protein A2Z17_04625 [Gammaproteobacteria bacterium RBG_16_66_13]|nr:MAG: hypothetical protein A2Z17_04625 [Gammaproteobacteria bacterium RBG_16_66_13]